MRKFCQKRVGYTIGPIGNEESLIRESLHEKLYFYDLPIIIGGPYFQNNLSEKYSYYTDLQMAIHRVNLDKDRIKPVLTYHHQELRWTPWEENSPFLGGGLEFIWIYIDYPENANYNFYNSTHVHPYLSMGIKTNVKKCILGLTLKTRIGIKEDKIFDGSGGLNLEITKEF